MEKETSKRKLTLTDLAPAFIFLLTGHFLSFLVLIGEIALNRNMSVKCLKKNKKREKKITCNEESV